MSPEVELLLALTREMNTDRACEECWWEWRGLHECPVCGHVNADDPRDEMFDRR